MKTPLESLLSLKRWEEDEAKSLLATARNDLDLEKKRLSGLEENFRLLKEKMQYSDKAGQDISEIQKMGLHMEHLFSLLEKQKAIVADREKRLSEAMKILAEASKVRKTYETVDERHKASERLELKKKEQKRIDEHAVIRYKKK